MSHGGSGGSGSKHHLELVSSKDLPEGEELTPQELASWEKSRSNQSWIPMKLRMRMLRRDMDLIKYNSMETANFEDMMEKKDVKASDLQRAKMRERYQQKKAKSCALCEQQVREEQSSRGARAYYDLGRLAGARRLGTKTVPLNVDPNRVVLFCFRGAVCAGKPTL